MFVRGGGVDTMLEQIRDKHNSLELKTMMVQVISNISTMFYRPYAEKVVYQIKTAVEDKIL